MAVVAFSSSSSSASAATTSSTSPPPPPPPLTTAAAAAGGKKNQQQNRNPTLKAGATSNPLQTNNKKKHATEDENRTTKTGSIQIIERQVLDMDNNNEWKHVGWMTSGGQPCPSAYEYQLDDNTKEWNDDWKIAVSTQSPHGWEYETTTTSTTDTTTAEQPQPQNDSIRITQRHRTWVRTYIVTVPVQKKQQSHQPLTTISKRKKRKRKRRRGPVSKVWQNLSNDFHFKGFGWSLYKSIIFKNSFGIAFRIPLLSNFETWERHPSWPSLSASIAIYHPFSIMIFISGSVRMEWIQYICQICGKFLPFVFTQLFVSVLRGLALLVSAVLYPLTRKPLLLAVDHHHKTTKKIEEEGDDNNNKPGKQRTNTPNDFRTLLLRGPQYQRTTLTEDRLGGSYSWRWYATNPRKIETRISAWHFYSHQLPSYVGRRHSPCLGWSLSGPIPDEGYVLTASVLLSLSGYYYNFPRPAAVGRWKKYHRGLSSSNTSNKLLKNASTNDKKSFEEHPKPEPTATTTTTTTATSTVASSSSAGEQTTTETASTTREEKTAHTAASTVSS